MGAPSTHGSNRWPPYSSPIPAVRSWGLKPRILGVTCPARSCRARDRSADRSPLSRLLARFLGGGFSTPRGQRRRLRKLGLIARKADPGERHRTPSAHPGSRALWGAAEKRIIRACIEDNLLSFEYVLARCAEDWEALYYVHLQCVINPVFAAEVLGRLDPQRSTSWWTSS